MSADSFPGSPPCSPRSLEHADTLRKTYADFATYVAVEQSSRTEERSDSDHDALSVALRRESYKLSARGDVSQTLRRQSSAAAWQEEPAERRWSRHDGAHACAMAAASTNEWISVRGALSSIGDVAAKLHGAVGGGTKGLLVSPRLLASGILQQQPPQQQSCGSSAAISPAQSPRAFHQSWTKNNGSRPPREAGTLLAVGMRTTALQDPEAVAVCTRRVPRRERADHPPLSARRV